MAVGQHPEVMTGIMTEVKILIFFLAAFGSHNSTSGIGVQDRILARPHNMEKTRQQYTHNNE